MPDVGGDITPEGAGVQAYIEGGIGSRRMRGTGGGGGLLVALGFASIAALFVLYARYQSPELVTPGAVDGLVRIAVGCKRLGPGTRLLRWERIGETKKKIFLQRKLLQTASLKNNLLASRM